jgi:hypothetical protein
MLMLRQNGENPFLVGSYSPFVAMPKKTLSILGLKNSLLF